MESVLKVLDGAYDTDSPARAAIRTSLMAFGLSSFKKID